MPRSACRTLICALLGVMLPAVAMPYPGGTPHYVTDVAPFCAGCHSSVGPEQLRGVPEARVKAELSANKHLAKIRSAPASSPYAKLAASEREALIGAIQKLDAASSVKLIAPSALKVGQVFEVTVEAYGGGGPVVGIALVDSAQRWQARPAPSAGWQVIDKPRVFGPDGTAQTDFTDRRDAALAPGVAYVNVYGIEADVENGRYAAVSVLFRLRAPARPGTYPLAVVFFYGTEKGVPLGAVQTLRGPAPLGGYTAAAGRIRFSEVLQVTVE